MYALVDCNNFYASCERVFNPKLNNKPIIVLSNNDGCVIARSNEAKSFGIQMGEPAFKIKNIISQYKIQTFSTNFALYGDMSKRVMNTLSSIISDIEIYSIDEAFLDLSNYNDPYALCSQIRSKVLQYTGIPVSVGIGRTKTLSKIANRIAKKSNEYNGVFMLKEEKEDYILNQISVDNIWGIGRNLSSFLKSYHIKTAKQFKSLNLNWVRSNINIVGEKIVRELRGEVKFKLDNSHNTKQSICTSRTFGHMVNNFTDLSSSIAMYTTRCAEKLRSQNSYANFIHIFIQTNPFRKELKQYTKTEIIKFNVATNNTSEMISCSIRALKSIYQDGFMYKKAGVILTGIVQKGQVQGNLFDNINRNKDEKIISAVDKINRKMGQDIVRYAALGYKKKWQLKQERLSPCYTTRWTDILKIKLN